MARIGRSFQIRLELSEDDRARLRRIAGFYNMSMARWVRDAVIEIMDRHDRLQSAHAIGKAPSLPSDNSPANPRTGRQSKRNQGKGPAR